MEYVEGEPVYTAHFKDNALDILVYREAAIQIDKETPYPIDENDPDAIMREPMEVGKVYPMPTPSTSWSDMSDAYHEALEAAGIPDMECFGAEANWYAWYRAEAIRHMITETRTLPFWRIVAAVSLAMDEVTRLYPGADASATEARGAYSYYLAEDMYKANKENDNGISLEDHVNLDTALGDENMNRILAEDRARWEAEYGQQKEPGGADDGPE